MNWTTLLTQEINYHYGVTEQLLDLVDDDRLDWKPTTGENWMTVGQLLYHITDACGKACKGFVTGDWGMPEGMDFDDIPPEQMMPPAEAMPAVSSVAEARRLLAEDRELALEMVTEAGESDLEQRMLAAPWEPPGSERPLGAHLLGMIQHLVQHKGQLFYYLKLEGKPVNTHHLWGM